MTLGLWTSQTDFAHVQRAARQSRVQPQRGDDLDIQTIAMGGGQIKENWRTVSHSEAFTPYSFIKWQLVAHVDPWSTWQTDFRTDWSPTDWSCRPNRTEE